MRGRGLHRWMYALLLAMLSSSAARAEMSVAVLGDSLATGAATHPGLVYDPDELWRAFTGEISLAPDLAHLPTEFQELGSLPPPLRPWPGVREYRGGVEWVYAHFMQGIGRVFLDTEQYSWGYLVGRRLGAQPSQIMIVGQNGARMDAMPRQIDRAIAAGNGVLPRKVLVMYTGNDLCGPAVPMTTDTATFKKELSQGIAYTMRNAEPHPEGTEIVIISFLSVLQLLHSDDILNKSVMAYGEQTTCRDLRARRYAPPTPEDKVGPESVQLPSEAWLFRQMMPPKPSNMCPTLFGLTAGTEDDEAISALANRIRDYRQAQADVVNDYQEQLGAEASTSAWRVSLITDTAALRFDADDIGVDCFHLSAKGQAKVAEAILAGLDPKANH